MSNVEGMVALLTVPASLFLVTYCRSLSRRTMKLVLIVLLVCVAAVGANAQNKPNVVIMLADNVGYGDIGAYGAGEVRGMPTPRIDAIAQQGLRLTQYLVEPGCTPSRAALTTGFPQSLTSKPTHAKR